MKKMIAATLLSAFIAAPALAFEFDTSKLSVGAGYGFGNSGVLSVHGDYDIADETDNPIKVRLGYDRYSLGRYWSYNVFYGGAYYDFNEIIGLDEKIHPFAGLGLGFVSLSCSELCGSSVSTGGLYYIAGVQYDINEQFSAEVSFSAWGGMALGANYNFD